MAATAAAAAVDEGTCSPTRQQSASKWTLFLTSQTGWGIDITIEMNIFLQQIRQRDIHSATKFGLICLNSLRGTYICAQTSVHFLDSFTVEVPDEDLHTVDGDLSFVCSVFNHSGWAVVVGTGQSREEVT